MKKFAPIVAIALLGMMFTSCKKKNDCVCKDSSGNEVFRVDLSSATGTKSTVCSAYDAIWGSCKLQ
jgi:hypothetical protein